MLNQSLNNEDTRPKPHQMRLLARQAMMPLRQMHFYQDSDSQLLNKEQLEQLKECEYIIENTNCIISVSLSDLGNMLASIASVAEDEHLSNIASDLLPTRRLMYFGWLIEGLNEMLDELRQAEIEIGDIRQQQLKIASGKSIFWTLKESA